MNYHISWQKFIKDSKHLEEMLKFISNTKDICPTSDKVFRFLSCDISNAKYIILGMDPYSSTYMCNGKVCPVATGRAFEVANVYNFTDKYKQVSLSNIFKALAYYKFNKKYTLDELRNINCKNPFKYNNIHLWFDEMEKQGVIFLNSTLTTIIGKSGTHINIWTDFMNELLYFILSASTCKWMIWGTDALKRVDEIVPKSRIIYSCHPASRVNNDFIENCCFKKCKDINWF